MEESERIDRLAESIVRLFTEADLAVFHKHSCEKAQPYLTGKVEEKWKTTIEEII